MNNNLNKKILLYFFSVFFSFHLFSQNKTITIETTKLVELSRLSSYEMEFKEYSKIIESNYKEISAGRSPEYLFFIYKNTENFTLQGLAARCNINYDTLATLNRIESSNTSIKNKTLILPTVQGLFIPETKANNSLEVLLKDKYEGNKQSPNSFYCKIDDVPFIFQQGKRLSSTERAYFLDSTLGLPLPQDSFWVSSEFGKRKNPITGLMKNHNGIDLAADEGTPVYAIKDGAAAFCIENDKEFGNYIILQHDNGKTTSVYAHLSKINLEQYENVKKGDIIGYVGQTGLVTGPHLHFEIRTGGKAEDPRSKIDLPQN